MPEPLPEPRPEDLIEVGLPQGNEELRLWAKAVADLHKVGSIIERNASLFIPGEHVDEFRAAWKDSDQSFRHIVNMLTPTQGDVPGRAADLVRVNLTGPAGELKRSNLAQDRDGFLSQFRALPIVENMERGLRRAAAFATRYFEMGAVAVDSLAVALKEVPGVETACKVVEEGLLGLKYLLERKYGP